MNYRDNMNSETIVQMNKQSANYTDEQGLNFYEFGTTEGVIAGVGMSVLLTLLEVFYVSQEPHILAQFAVNIVLLGVIAYALNKYKDFLPTDSIFRSGILMGAYISGVAGLIIAAVNIILTLFVPTLGLSLFGFNALAFSDAMLMSFGMFLVTFVNGMIITFVCLQFLKNGGTK